MNCPACGHSLTRMTVENVEVDVCKGGCGGVWFDNWELRHFDEPDEMAGDVLLDVEIDPGAHVNHTERIKCPRCPDMIMMRHFFTVKCEVEVDECPQCAGMWLDATELRKIRSQYNSEEERKQAAAAFFDEKFNPRIDAMLRESKEKAESAHRTARRFRFICPTYWIPGKQDWGAF